MPPTTSLQTRLLRTIALFILLALLASCTGWRSLPKARGQAPAAQSTLTFVTIPTIAPTPEPQVVSAVETPEQVRATPEQPLAPINPAQPAGCLSASEQAKLDTMDAMLAYASSMVRLPKSLARRRLPSSWNAYTQTNLLPDSGALSLSVGDIDPQYQVQRTLNALQVAGFVTWLRRSSTQGLHILAVPLRGADWTGSPWTTYMRAYWAGSQSVPEDDATIIPVMKTPPCRWMVEKGYAPEFQVSGWDRMVPTAPDYARYAAAYQAKTTAESAQVARRINWLGDAGIEGPNTMCGPLAWAILNDAGALPPGYGGWSSGPKAFWLAKPRENGRPWSLFPPELYQVHHYNEPLGTFDFRTRQPLYPGDFLYTYAIGDGFDHMLVVTERDDAGDIYTVTNIIHMVPEKKTTIERVLLLNLDDPALGIARNQWAKDRKNGRTGQHGFDVFRWAWVQKDIDQQAVEYTVQPGDTLTSIAAEWRTPVDQIARYNGIKVGSGLSVGQSLWIPPNAGGVS